MNDPRRGAGAAFARRSRDRSRLGSAPTLTEPLTWGGTERRPGASQDSRLKSQLVLLVVPVIEAVPIARAPCRIVRVVIGDRGLRTWVKEVRRLHPPPRLRY